MKKIKHFIDTHSAGKPKMFQKIAFTNWDRLARDSVTEKKLKKMFEQNDIELILLDEEDEVLDGFTGALYLKKSTEVVE